MSSHLGEELTREPNASRSMCRISCLLLSLPILLGLTLCSHKDKSEAHYLIPTPILIRHSLELIKIIECF